MEGWISLIETILTKRAFIAIFFVGIGLLKFFGFDYDLIQENPVHSIFVLSSLCLLFIIGMYYNFLAKIKNLEHMLNKLEFSSLKRMIDVLLKTNSNVARDIQEILELCVTTNNAVKNIPNKDVLIKLCSVKTRYLSNAVLESYIDYVTTLSNAHNAEMIENAKLRFERQFIKLKKEYINDLYRESKDTLSLDIKPILEEHVDTCFNKIITTVSTDVKLTEKTLYFILNEIRNLEETISGIYEQNLLLTSFDSSII